MKCKQKLDRFLDGMQDLGNEAPETVNAFMELLKASHASGQLDVKTKELISVAISCYNRCKYCIVYYATEALKAGATREEIIEAAMVAVAFGGESSMACSVTVLKEALDEFS